MGVLKTITLLIPFIIGAVGFRIEYVPLDPNYLPYFDPTFNAQEYLLNSASTNYLIPKIQPTSTSGNNEPKDASRTYLPMQQSNQQAATGNADYYVPTQQLQISNEQQSVSRNREYFLPEDFGKRILEIKQNNDRNLVPPTTGNSGYENPQSNDYREELKNDNYGNKLKLTSTGYPNLKDPAEINRAIYSIYPNYGKNLENQEGYTTHENSELKSSDYDYEYYRNLEKQAELETEEKIRAEMKKSVYVKKPGGYSSYVMTMVNNSPATGNVETYQEVNLGDPKQPRRGRKLEQVNHQDSNEADKKEVDVTADTNDWEPISAPYDHYNHKEESTDDNGEVHYHQHKHIHNHAHHQDHAHIHDQDHKHVHESSHSHGHSHDENHGHSHQSSHKHGHEHHQIHQHDHKENHGHDHGHKHQHIEAHKHGHQEGHKHDHGHKHEHGHDHKHTSEHKHGHDHGHKHSHYGEHNHGHNHGHKHSHDHGHQHSHSDEHGHEHKHGHEHGHKHEHKHSKH